MGVSMLRRAYEGSGRGGEGLRIFGWGLVGLRGALIANEGSMRGLEGFRNFWEGLSGLLQPTEGLLGVWKAT